MSNTILLVEDDENDVFFMRKASKRLGFSIRCKWPWMDRQR